MARVTAPLVVAASAILPFMVRVYIEARAGPLHLLLLPRVVLMRPLWSTRTVMEEDELKARGRALLSLGPTSPSFVREEDVPGTS